MIKASQKWPSFLLVERGKVVPDMIYVQAHVDIHTGRVKFLGWMRGRDVVEYEPERSIWTAYEVWNHKVPLTKARKMDRLYARLGVSV